tara:strand:- start:1521 stop:2636 length:1116 start_codon:yes stop_codon:yes gene_type:complete
MRDHFGRKNPNKKYFFDEGFFNKIVSEEKAYFLGWIASDGYIGENNFSLYINKKDVYILEQLKNLICPEIPIRNKPINLKGFTINSKRLSERLRNLLNIKEGEKKSKVVNFPEMEEFLKWHFLRGYFDGDGTIRKINETHRSPECSITSSSHKMLNQIRNFVSISSSINYSNNSISWYGNNALDFLGKIYDSCYKKFSLALPRKKNLYDDICCWSPTLRRGKNIRGKIRPFLKWAKTKEIAIPPFKKNVSDSGFDLNVVEEFKPREGRTYFYDTCIKIQPDFGWYYEVVPRSSIYKTGYLLTNSVGTIDRTYIGSIKIILYKFDDTKPDLELPIRVVQIIPKIIIHPELVEVKELDDTERGEGGFGSTGTR